MTVMYEIDEINFINNIYFYTDKEIGNHIDIAVSKNNPNKVRCCILSDEICDKIYDNSIWLITFFIVFECIFLINKLILKKIIKKNDNNSMKRIDEEKEISIRFSDKEIGKKQEIILTSYKNIQGSNLSVDDIAETIIKYDISFNNDYIWCLVNLSQEEMSNYDLLPMDGNISVINETVRLRELGLPPKYYVIAKNNNYFCGREDSSRIFCFSFALGITNTTYVDLYDYILEKLEQKQQ